MKEKVAQLKETAGLNIEKAESLQELDPGYFQKGAGGTHDPFPAGKVLRRAAASWPDARPGGPRRSDP